MICRAIRTYLPVAIHVTRWIAFLEMVSFGCSKGSSTSRFPPYSYLFLLLSTFYFSQPLDCGLHRCSRRCHVGGCGDCQQVVDKRCQCGATTKSTICGQALVCDKRCNRMRFCSRHRCHRKCCDGNCPPCPEVNLTVPNLQGIHLHYIILIFVVFSLPSITGLWSPAQLQKSQVC